MGDQNSDTSPAMGVANMLSTQVLPYLVQVEPPETRQRLMELYDSMLRVALGAHHAGKR